VASLFSGLVFGAIPILKYGGPQLAQVLRGSARNSSDSRERHRARNVLVVAQVALALVLLVGSGLMIRTFQTLRGVQPGFSRPEQLQMVRVALPDSQFPDAERAARTLQEILDGLAAIPGVSAAAFTSASPLEPFNSNDPVVAEDKQYAPGQIPPIRRFKFVSPGLFKTLGTTLIVGRDITWNDIYRDQRVAIVSEGMAREMWKTPEAALGKRLRVGANDAWREIVGVVGDVHDNGVHEAPPGTVYWPILMSSFWGNERFVRRSATFIVRSDRAATEGLLTQVRDAVWSVNGNLPLSLVRTLEDVYDASLARTSFTVVMLAIAGVMALLLGVIGIYGVLSYTVSQRTREIGIRMALGMQNGAVRRMFVRDGLLLVIVGVAAGLASAVGLSRLMASLLFQVSPLDPLTYAGVAMMLLIAGALASYLPARRATTLDPAEALRSE
jgi:putative ABC transport system permease protein